MPQDEQTRWLNDALAGVKRSAFFMGKAMVRSFFSVLRMFLHFRYRWRRFRASNHIHEDDIALELAAEVEKKREQRIKRERR